MVLESRPAAAVGRELDLAVLRHPLLHEFPERLQDLSGILLAHQPEAHLCRCPWRQYRLGAGTGRAAENAVHLGSRPRPDLFEHALALLASRLRQPDLGEEI